jgi:hypothetical protein
MAISRQLRLTATFRMAEHEALSPSELFLLRLKVGQRWE